MKRRTKFIIVALAAALALAAGLTTMVLAHGSAGKASDGSSVRVACSDDLTTDNITSTFISKVASILGLPESQVADAFRQARSQMLDEAIQRRLEQAVANGRLTQDQADQILQWIQDRPEALDQFGGFGGPSRILCGGRMMGSRPMMSGRHRCGW